MGAMNGGDVIGVVLAGGRGRRMGGGDKGLLKLGGMTLAAIAVRRLQKQTRAVIINANRNHLEYQQTGCPVVADAAVENGGKDENDKRKQSCESENNKRGGFDNRGGDKHKRGGVDNFGGGNADGGVDDSCRFAGPLAGMLAGMRAADGEWVLFVPCDCPFFPATLARELAAGAKKQNADIAVAVAGGREQPVFMLVRRRLFADMAAFVGGGGRKIDLWYGRHQCAKVLFDDAEAFANINTPEDLAAAQKRLLSA
ncbi:MAG: molybdenum cofactor guanylyltransferase [Gammaproteobacteria bacterium]